jgi:hypothetical protein
MLCLSYYCLYLLFNKIGEKGRTGSACKQGGFGGEEGDGGRGRTDPKSVCTCEYMNKDKKRIYLIPKGEKKTYLKISGWGGEG